MKNDSLFKSILVTVICLTAVPSFAQQGATDCKRYLQLNYHNSTMMGGTAHLFGIEIGKHRKNGIHLGGAINFSFSGIERENEFEEESMNFLSYLALRAQYKYKTLSYSTLYLGLDGGVGLTSYEKRRRFNNYIEGTPMSPLIMLQPELGIRMKATEQLRISIGVSLFTFQPVTSQNVNRWPAPLFGIPTLSIGVRHLK